MLSAATIHMMRIRRRRLALIKQFELFALARGGSACLRLVRGSIRERKSRTLRTSLLSRSCAAHLLSMGQLFWCNYHFIYASEAVPLYDETAPKVWWPT